MNSLSQNNKARSVLKYLNRRKRKSIKKNLKRKIRRAKKIRRRRNNQRKAVTHPDSRHPLEANVRKGRWKMRTKPRLDRIIVLHIPIIKIKEEAECITGAPEIRAMMGAIKEMIIGAIIAITAEMIEITGTITKTVIGVAGTETTTVTTTITTITIITEDRDIGTTVNKTATKTTTTETETEIGTTITTTITTTTTTEIIETKAEQTMTITKNARVKMEEGETSMTEGTITITMVEAITIMGIIREIMMIIVRGISIMGVEGGIGIMMRGEVGVVGEEEGGEVVSKGMIISDLIAIMKRPTRETMKEEKLTRLTPLMSTE